MENENKKKYEKGTVGYEVEEAKEFYLNHPKYRKALKAQLFLKKFGCEETEKAYAEVDKGAGAKAPPV